MKLRLLPVLCAITVFGSSCGDEVVNGPANNPPRLYFIADHNMTAGETREVEIFATDAEGDAITFSVADNPGFLSLTGASQAGDTAKVTIVIAPTAGQTGTFTGTIRVADGKGGDDSRDFSVKVDPFAPESGEWMGLAEFGMLGFTVNDQGTEITEVSFGFHEFQCGGAGPDVPIASTVDPLWPIADREFTIEGSFPGLSMTIHGRFISNLAASGTWSGVSFGNTCSGVWQVSSPGFTPAVGVFMNASFNQTEDVGGYKWMPGGQVTLEIDYGGDGTLDFQRTTTVDNDAGARFQQYLREPAHFAVAEGDSVKMYDGFTSIAYAVEYVKLKLVDYEADLVSGSARPGTAVNVEIADPALPSHGRFSIDLVADATGSWTADFTGICDIVPSTDGWVSVSSSWVSTHWAASAFTSIAF
jgi:hypothetical protein